LTIEHVSDTFATVSFAEIGYGSVETGLLLRLWGDGHVGSF
jgi:hypothetical protein